MFRYYFFRDIVAVLTICIAKHDRKHADVVPSCCFRTQDIQLCDSTSSIVKCFINARNVSIRSIVPGKDKCMCCGGSVGTGVAELIGKQFEGDFGLLILE